MDTPKGSHLLENLSLGFRSRGKPIDVHSVYHVRMDQASRMNPDSQPSPAQSQSQPSPSVWAHEGEAAVAAAVPSHE